MDTDLMAAARSLGGVTGISALLLAIVTYIKARPLLKKIDADSDASLRGDLLERITTLEARLDEAYTRISGLEKTLSRKGAEHAAEEALLRHQLRDEAQSLDSFLLLAQSDPDKLREMIPAVIEQRRQSRDRLAMEKAVVSAARIQEEG